MNQFNYNSSQGNYPPPYNGGSGNVAVVNSVLRLTYFKMFLGLLVSAFVALWASSSETFMTYYATHSYISWIGLIVEFGIVFAIGSVQRLSSPVASLLFYVFSAINGFVLSPILLVYTSTSIAKTFFITAGMFAAMSAYGYFTKSDLSKWGQYLFYALIGLIICMIVNIFTKSSGFEWLISFVGVLIFVGLTAWDTQFIKRISEQAPPQMAGRLSTIGALSLYLDFVNMFLFMLRLFGGGRD